MAKSGPPDISAKAESIVANFQSSGQNQDKCRAAVPVYQGLIIGGAFVFHFSGYIDLLARDAGSETGEAIGWAGMGVGVGMIGAGIVVGYQACY